MCFKSNHREKKVHVYFLLFKVVDTSQGLQQR